MKAFAFMLVFAALAAFALPIHAQEVGIQVSQVTPQPVEPGNDLTLQISYANFANTPINNLKASLDLQYPFTLTSETDSFEGGINICGFCSRSNTYIIHTDQAATSGLYHIFVRLDSQQGGQSVQILNISVVGKPNIILLAAPVNGAVPSSQFTLPINVSNIGTGTAKQVKVVSKSSDFVALGGSAASVASVNAGQSTQISFMLSPDSDLAASSYNLPFEIDFKDEQGNSYNITQSVGVQVVNSGTLNIEDIKTASASGGQPQAGTPTTIIVRLQNVGHGDANGIRTQLTCSGITSSAFLGQLKKDEDAPAVFSFTLPQGGTIGCTLATTYQDDLGAHAKTDTFNVDIASQGFPAGLVVLAVIIIILIYYFFGRRKKKK